MALTGPLEIFSSPYNDFISASTQATGPNGLIFKGPLVISHIQPRMILGFRVDNRWL
jgi:hypothetical protein